MSLEKAKAIVKELYDDDQVINWQKISELIQNCVEKRRDLASEKLTERDALLISYGDHVRSEEMSSCLALSEFLTLASLNKVITYIHFLPFFPYSSDDGFSVIDYESVDESVGSWADIENLAQHQKMAFDFALNHSSKSCKWFKGFLEGREEFKNFYVEASLEDDLSQVVRPRTHPLLTQFNKKFVWTTFSDDQVDFNYQNPLVFEKMIETFLFYLEKGAQMIRMDAIAFLWKEIGTNCLHHPNTHRAVKLFREVAKAVDSNIIILTETNVPHSENISYFGDKDEADMVYQFSLPPMILYSIWKGEISSFVDWAKEIDALDEEYLFLNFTASHDGIGVRPMEGLISENDSVSFFNELRNQDILIGYKSNSDGSESPYEINSTYFSTIKALLSSKEKEVAQRAFRLSQVLMLSFKGLPAIYLNSLLMAENDVAGYKESGIKRRVNRKKYNLSDLNLQLNEANSGIASTVSFFNAALEARGKSGAFSPYARQTVTAISQYVLQVQRTSLDGTERVNCLFNFGSNSALIPPEVLNLGQKNILLDSDAETRKLNDHKDATGISSFGYMWVEN